MLARYPVGKLVDVRYHPRNPRNALLEPGFAIDLLISIIIGIVLTVIGAVMEIWLLGFVYPEKFQWAVRLTSFNRRGSWDR